jgi:hypothetical protein
MDLSQPGSQPAQTDSSNSDEHGEDKENNPQKHHHIGRSSKDPIRITKFVRDYAGDPAAKVFTPNLLCNYKLNVSFVGFHAQIERPHTCTLA